MTSVSRATHWTSPVAKSRLPKLSMSRLEATAELPTTASRETVNVALPACSDTALAS